MFDLRSSSSTRCELICTSPSPDPICLTRHVVHSGAVSTKLFLDCVPSTPDPALTLYQNTGDGKTRNLHCRSAELIHVQAGTLTAQPGGSARSTSATTPAAPSTSAAPSTTIAGGGTAPPSTNAGDGLSTEAKIGLGVGLGVGIPGLLIALLAWCCPRQSKKPGRWGQFVYP